jgi:hypothetical protein
MMDWNMGRPRTGISLFNMNACKQWSQAVMEFEHCTTPAPYMLVIKNTLYAFLETWQCLPDSYFAAMYCCTILDVNEERDKNFEYEVKQRLFPGQLNVIHIYSYLYSRCNVLLNKAWIYVVSCVCCLQQHFCPICLILWCHTVWQN